MNERLKYVLIAVNVSLIGCCSSALALDYPSAGVVPNRTPLVTREVQPDPDILMNSTVIRDESDVLDALVGVSKLGDYRYEVAPGQLQAMPSAQSMSGSIQLKLVTILLTARYLYSLITMPPTQRHLQRNMVLRNYFISQT
jgi:hypothetical protein